MDNAGLSRQAKLKLEKAKRHRINSARVAISNQISFFNRHFGQVVSDWKADSSRVTFADIAISENLFSDLVKDFPNDDFCSEEMNPNSSIKKLHFDFAWVLDPIDGTNNFALGFPLCGISLALCFRGIPVYGFVYDYSINSLYEGGPKEGLFKNKKKYKNIESDLRSKKIIGVQFPLEESLFHKLTPIFSCYKIRALGSSTLLGLLAANGYLEGIIDTRAKVWDVAATVALAQSVGNKVNFLKKSPFPMMEFHPSMPACPYYSGSKSFCSKIESLII